MNTSPDNIQPAQCNMLTKNCHSGLKKRMTPEKLPESFRGYQSRRLISNKSSQDIFLDRAASSRQPFQTSRYSTKTKLELSPKFGDIASRYLVNASTITGSDRKRMYRRMHSALSQKSMRQNTSIVSNATSYASMVSGKAILKTKQRGSMITRTSRVTSSKSPGIKRINQYFIVKTLGAGSYGKVKLCEDVKTSKNFAMKIISRDLIKKKRPGNHSERSMHDMVEEMLQEMKFLTEMHHANIIKLHEIIDDP